MLPAPDLPVKGTPGEKEAPEQSSGWPALLTGAVLGMLLWTALLALVGNPALLPFWDGLILPAGIAGALLMRTRAAALLWTAGALLCAATLLIGWTPLIVPGVRGLVRREPPQRAEAVVVLSSDIQGDGELTSLAQDRLLHGLELLGQGYAPRLVLTRLFPPKHASLPAVRQQMARLGLSYPVDEVGEVRNTRDEAVAAAQLAEKRGWRRVLLVTSPTHTRRAVATFRKAGLPVISSPCPERRYDLESLEEPPERIRAFREWLHEVIGYETYRRRGWL